ncbi:MAG: acyltransferase, partial [Prevotellaceae bacterium]|nr:acyltransferase [Prevotellaceae bacterium]
MSLFERHSPAEFEQACLSAFRWQAQACEPYARYLACLGVNPDELSSAAQVPFLPIEFFRTERVVCGSAKAQRVFTSSGTSGAETSRHYVSDALLYEESLLRGFEHFYGAPQGYCI